MNESFVCERAESVFHAALEHQDSEARERFLEEACAGDAELRVRLERLLRAHAQAETQFLKDSPNFGDDSPARAALSVPKSEAPGDHIGNYKLVEELGAGGFGVVWMAEQERPVRRKVALKIIKLGMDTKEVIARFEQERQALALMDHPNIAKMHDAGATTTGRPFFVMELVRGIRITD